MPENFLVVLSNLKQYLYKLTFEKRKVLVTIEELKRDLHSFLRKFCSGAKGFFHFPIKILTTSELQIQQMKFFRVYNQRAHNELFRVYSQSLELII